MKDKMQKTWLTTSEVGELLGYNAEYVAKICLEWEKFGVKTHRLGRKFLFKADEINQMVEMHAIN